MRQFLPKLAVVVGVILIVFVSYSLGSKQSDTTANNPNEQLKVDVMTFTRVPGNNPDIPRVVRDYSKVTPPAKEVMFALVSFSNGSTLVVPQGGWHTSEEVGQDQTNIFILRGNVLTLTGTVNINSVIAVYK